MIADYEFHNKRGLEDLRWRAEKHLRRPFEQILALALTSEKLKSYKKDRRLGGAADATINRELAVIRRGFTLAKQAGLYRGDTPHFGLFKLDNARQGFVEDRDYRKLLEALPSHLKCLAIAGYHLGMRAGELRKLQWFQVDLGNREIRLAASQTKGKRPRTAPVYGDLIPALLQQKAEHDANCQTSRGSSIGWENQLDTASRDGVGRQQRREFRTFYFMTFAAKQFGTWNGRGFPER